MESETAFGETIEAVRSVRLQPVAILKTSLSPDRTDAENDKLRGAGDLRLEQTEEALSEAVEGNLKSPMAAMLTICFAPISV